MGIGKWLALRWQRDDLAVFGGSDADTCLFSSDGDDRIYVYDSSDTSLIGHSSHDLIGGGSGNSEARFAGGEQLQVDHDGDGATDISILVGGPTAANPLTGTDFLWLP